MRKSSYLFRLLAVIVLTASTVLPTIGQIGYQLAVLDQETGSPKRNASVSVDVTNSDSKGNTVFNRTYNETTNDFGMVSLQVGDSDTFSSMDWQNLPLFISATIDGSIEVGRSQILTVPVTEYAKTTGVLTKEILCSKTWKYERHDNYADRIIKFTFFKEGTCNYVFTGDKGDDNYTGTYYIDNNFVYMKYSYTYDDGYGQGIKNGITTMVLKYMPELNEFWYPEGGDVIYK